LPSIKSTISYSYKQAVKTSLKLYYNTPQTLPKCLPPATPTQATSPTDPRKKFKKSLVKVAKLVTLEDLPVWTPISRLVPSNAVQIANLVPRFSNEHEVDLVLT
jgi:hypothetical protein